MKLGQNLSSSLCLIASLFALSACATAAVGAITETGVSIAEERSVGRKVDDLTIYTEINHLFLQRDANDVLPNVTVNVRHGRVLLTGNVKKPESVGLAAKLAWQVNGVEEVINEINVDPKPDFFDSANDGLIKKNLETRLFFTKDVWVINYSIDVVSNVVYLLGNVKDEAELERVLNIARTTKGVKKVVNYLRVDPKANTDQAPAATTSGSDAGFSSPTPQQGGSDSIDAIRAVPNQSFDTFEENGDATFDSDTSGDADNTRPEF